MWYTTQQQSSRLDKGTDSSSSSSSSTKAMKTRHKYTSIGCEIARTFRKPSGGADATTYHPRSRLWALGYIERRLLFHVYSMLFCVYSLCSLISPFIMSSQRANRTYCNVCTCRVQGAPFRCHVASQSSQFRAASEVGCLVGPLL